MSKKMKIGIIGSGGIAAAHAQAYKRMNDVEVIAVTDVIPGKAKEFIRQNELDQAQSFDDHLQLLELKVSL